MQQAQLQLRVVWSDEDLAFVEVSGRGSGYAGATTVYLALDRQRELADEIQGYPQTPLDERVVRLGDPDRQACGYFEMHLLPGQGTGLSRMRVSFFSNPHRDSIPDASAAFTLSFEPACLDRFVDALRSADLQTGEVIDFLVSS